MQPAIANLEVAMAVCLRTLFLWDMTSCYWVLFPVFWKQMMPWEHWELVTQGCGIISQKNEVVSLLLSLRAPCSFCNHGRLVLMNTVLLSQLLQVHVFHVLNYGKYNIYLPFFVLMLHTLYLVCVSAFRGLATLWLWCEPQNMAKTWKLKLDSVYLTAFLFIYVFIYCFLIKSNLVM